MGLFGKTPPERIQIGDTSLQCQICKNGLFWQREAQLNTAIATLFRLDWTNQSANCYVCSKCGYIHWFLPQ
jgi:hypothetical protein